MLATIHIMNLDCHEQEMIFLMGRIVKTKLTYTDGYDMYW